jgi:hypothetical protein
MTAMADTNTDWQREVIDLKAQGLSAAEIADAVGKHAATVRKVIARNADEIERVGELNGHAEAEAGPYTMVDGEKVPVDLTDVPLPISGQVDIDGNEAAFTKAGAENPPPLVPGLDDSEVHAVIDRDPLEDFKAEAGEAVGDMQERPGEEPAGVLEEPAHYEVVQGTRQMAIDFGPEADIPTGGTLVVKSEKLASGFFGLGDVITGTFTARIVSAGGKERFNEASEQFRAEPQAHVALITEVSIGAVGGDA